MSNFKIAFIALGTSLIAVSIAFACGPFFEYRALQDRKGFVLTAPRQNYEDVLGRMMSKRPKSIEEKYAQDSYYHLDESDLNDLKSALPKASDELLNQYKQTRAAITNVTKDTQKDALAQLSALPKSIPQEFVLYLRGAIAFRTTDFESARNQWMSLLLLPKNERHFRTTWATFMIGRSFANDSDYARARPWFEQTRELAKEGFSDQLNLAAETFGFEARGFFELDDFEEAANLYKDQWDANDDSAALSLAFVAREIVQRSDSTISQSMKHAVLRKSLLALALSAADSCKKGSVASRIANAMVHEKKKPVEDADILAWLNYSCGRFDSAKHFLSIADKNTSIALWIQSKLEARAGHFDRASSLLAKALRALPEKDSCTYVDEEGEPRFCRERLSGELGVVEMTRKNFVEALDLFSHHGSWSDAAYVAERVLSIKELQTYVDAHAPQPASTLKKQTNNTKKKCFQWKYDFVICLGVDLLAMGN